MKEKEPNGRLSSDYNGRCGNCQAFLNGDKYCRFCGTKAGEGSYAPYNDTVYTVYGPPPQQNRYKCAFCGKVFVSWAMGDEIIFCPDCGGKLNKSFFRV